MITLMHMINELLKRLQWPDYIFLLNFDLIVRYLRLNILDFFFQETSAEPDKKDAKAANNNNDTSKEEEDDGEDVDIDDI